MTSKTVEVFIVGKVDTEDEKRWEFCGVFSTVKNAQAACKTDDYFIGPSVIDELIPDKPTVWPGAIYTPPGEDGG